MRFLIAFALISLPALAMADGKADFTTLCASCHGATGAGDGAAAAALNPKPASFATAELWKRIDEVGHNGVKGDAYVKKVLKEGGAAVGRSPLMAPMGAGMTDAQIADLTKFIRSLKK
jgi:cytochrome c553